MDRTDSDSTKDPSINDANQNSDDIDNEKDFKDVDAEPYSSPELVLANSPNNDRDQSIDLEKAIEENEDRSGAGTPVQRVVTAQDWTGPDDPENPYNWSMTKRVYNVVIPAIFGFSITFGTSVFSPAYRQLAAHFNVSPTAGILGITLYVLGLAFGPVLAAPMSETYGRRVVYRVTLPLSMFFTLGAGFSKSFGTFCVCRLLAGLTGSPVLAVGGGTNADLFPPHQRAIASGFFLLAPFLGPALGPVVGGFVVQYKNWRWTQWVMLFLAVACYAASAFQSETYKKTILQKRSKRLGIPPPPNPRPAGFAGVKFFLTVTLLRPLHMLFTEPIVFFFSMYTAFTFAILFSFFEAFPIVFNGIYGFNTWQTGLTFLGVGLGVSIATITTVIIDRTIYRKHSLAARQEGKLGAQPEHRLYGAMAGGPGITMALFWFAWTARPGVSWASPLVATIPFAWGNLSIFVCSTLYMIDVYGPLNGASALAANGIARYALGAVFPLFTVQMYNKLGVDWATSLLAFVSLAMVPIPYVLFRWGPKIRSKSGYETVKW